MIILKEKIFTPTKNIHSNFKSEEEFLIACQKNDLQYILKNHKNIFKSKSIFSFLKTKEPTNKEKLVHYMFYQIAGTHASAFDSIDVVKFLVEDDFFNPLCNDGFLSILYETASYYEALKTLTYLKNKSGNIESAIISAIENFSENSLYYFFTETDFQMNENILNAILSQPHKKEILAFFEKLKLKQNLEQTLIQKEEESKIFKV